MNKTVSVIPVLTAGLLSFPAWAGNTNAQGIPNFHAVNDHIYRGGQPSQEGWNSLAKLGVKTVIDLRRDGEDHDHWIKTEALAVETAGMRYVSVPMEGMATPSDEQIRKVLDVLGSGESVFVHCKKGKDRTGTVIACYRIEHDRWTNDRALKEAKSLGIHWVEFAMKHYISNYKAGSGNLAGMPDTAVVRP